MRYRRASWVAVILLGLAVMGAAHVEAARQFNGTTDYLNSASPINLTAYSKITIAFWVSWDSFSNNDARAIQHGVVGGPAADQAIADSPNSSAASNWRVLFNGNGGYASGELTRPSAATWHHVVYVLDRTLATNEVAAVYLDGVAQSLSHAFNANSTDAFGNLTFYVMTNGGTTSFGAGKFAELAIWGGYTFTQTDVNALYNGGAGVVATDVQSGSLVAYWRILGTSNPETATIGGVNLTVHGTTVAVHPFGLGTAPSGRVPANPLRSRVRRR